MTITSLDNVEYNFHECLEESKQFYRSHNLHHWADALDDLSFTFDEKINRTLAQALQQGFTEMIIFPSLNTQKTVINAPPLPSIVSPETPAMEILMKQLADTPVPGLSEEQQYHASILNYGIRMWHTIPDNQKTKREKPYLFLYSPRAIPQETKNILLPQINALFSERNWDGFTILEFYVAERQWTEKYKNHQLVAYDDDGSKSQWSWCLASRVQNGCATMRWYAGGSTYSPAGGFHIQTNWSEDDYCCEQLGARPALIVPID